MSRRRGQRRGYSTDTLQTPPKPSTIVRETRSGASYSKSTPFKPPTPSTAIKRPRSGSSAAIANENNADLDKVTPPTPSAPPTVNNGLRSGSINPAASTSSTNSITNRDSSPTPFVAISPPKKQQRRSRNKRAGSVDNGTNSATGFTASTNAPAESTKQPKNTKQAAVKKNYSSIVEEVDNDDPSSSEVDYLKGSESEPKELGGDKEDVIAALTVQRVDASRNIPDNMLRALEASSQNQANDMQVLTKLLSAASDNIAQQSSQSVWANNMLACLAEDLLKQQEQLRVQAACIQSMQQAMDAMARQQRFQGPIPGYSGQSNHFDISAVPGQGWLPPSGHNSATSSPTPKQNQSKSVKGSTPVAIRLLHPGSDIQDLPSTAAPPSIQHHPSELELLLKNQPKDTRPSETHPPEPAVRQSTGTKRSRGPPRDDWFIWTRDHNSTKSIYEEFRRYESELKAKLEPTDGNSKRRARLPQRQADNTERHVSNIRRIANEVDLIKKRLMQDDTLSKDDALLAAFEEIDGLVQRRSRDGNYSCNQATELCTEQMIARGELKTRK